MTITRSSRLAPLLGRFACALALAIALAPGPGSATEGVAEVAPEGSSPGELALLEQAAGGDEKASAVAAAEPATETAPEPAPAAATEPAPAPAAEPAAAAAQETAPAAATAAELPARPTNPLAVTPGSLDFNLLGPAGASLQVDERDLHLRRTMLNVHQGLGFGMLALQLGTTVFGQLNYSDRFYGQSTGKYKTPHQVFAYSTLGMFGTTALVALLAPSPLKKREGFDRITLHKIAMFTAKVGMVTQGILGIYTRDREGRLDQKSVATAHLTIGYATLAAIAVGFGAIAF